MDILDPKAELWIEKNPIAHVARCARVCYKSLPKDADSDKKLNQWLIKNGHLSPFRHSSYYFKIPAEHWMNPRIVETWLKKDIEAFWESRHPYVRVEKSKEGDVYISINGQTKMQYSIFNDDYNYNKIWRYEVSKETMVAECPDLARYTVFLSTSIRVTRELNRVSPNNICELSTRYVRVGTVLRPHWLSREDADAWLAGKRGSTQHARIVDMALSTCDIAFKNYQTMVDGIEGELKPIPKEEASGILPLLTYSDVVYTYTKDEWEHIMALRYYGKTGRPHPDAKIAATLIKEQLEKENVYL